MTLIKSVLDALPTYMLCLFPLPKSIGKKLKKLRRIFLWQGNKEKQGYNLVKWEEVTMSKAQGGLGIKNLQKWLWRLCCEDTALWRRFIVEKYGL